MRIHLPLHPHHFTPQSTAGPLARIGGDLVVIELQGHLEWEGDKADGVVGVLGLDRPDRPTLHIGEHHLLHGKMSNLPKPYAVIRKAAAPSTSEGHILEGDAAEEESDEEREEEEREQREQLGSAKKRKRGGAEGEEEEADGPLFPEELTPKGKGKDNGSRVQIQSTPASSVLASSPPRDYSSDLSSPPAWDFAPEEKEVDEDEEDEEAEKAREKERIKEREREQRRRERRERRRAEAPRTRYYEVVGVVRKKVVFALRPEPLVAATVLPE